MFNSQQSSKLFWKLSFCSIKLCVKPINWLENLINFKYPRHHIYLLLHKAWLWWKYLGVVHELCYIYFAAINSKTRYTAKHHSWENFSVYFAQPAFLRRWTVSHTLVSYILSFPLLSWFNITSCFIKMWCKFINSYIKKIYRLNTL